MKSKNKYYCTKIFLNNYNLLGEVMKNIFKLLGIGTILLFSFYYTEKFSNIVINNSSLVKEINNNKNEYNIEAVSAVIDDEYIIPGLNGYAVNVLKSYNNMKFLDNFNSNYLEYDIVKPNISLENNKNKIVKYGNIKKNSVALIIKDNIDILNYSKEKNIKITRLIDHNTFEKNSNYEQINYDYVEYNKVENMLNNINKNKNICYVDSYIEEVCKNDKYLITDSLKLNNYNLASIKDKIKGGYIIFINDNVSLVDYKLLLKQIYYQSLSIIPVSELISEER